MHDLQVHLLVVRDDRVVGSRGRNAPWGWATAVAILDKNLPSIIRLLKLVQIKGGEVVHEVALDLTTEDVYLGSQDVERVSVST